MKHHTAKKLLQICWTFMKISPVTFGGGFAMMPLMKKEVVDKRKWIGEEEMIDAFVLGQSAPGSVGVNSSAFIGYRIAGLKGAAAAVIGMMAPAFLIVIVLSLLFLTVRDNPMVEAAFKGIRPAVVALIVYAAISAAKSSILDKSTFVLVAVSVVLLIAFHVHPVLLIFAGMAAGIAIQKAKTHEKSGRATGRSKLEGKV
jgi:chromate transporter